MLLNELAVIVVRCAGPVNVGLIARACANLGVTDLRLVDPLADRTSDEARKFANKAVDFLQAAPVFATLTDAIHDRQFVVATSARTRAAPVACYNLPGLAQHPELSTSSALVFGNEAHGLDNAEVAQCHAVLALDTPGDYPSYNLSHAVVSCLTYLHHQAQSPQHTGMVERAPGEKLHELEHYWLATLRRFDHFRRIGPERGADELHELLRHAHLTERDCVVLRGMLAQFNYKCFGDKTP